MQAQTAARPNVGEYYRKIYAAREPVQHEWVAGSASPELIQLVWQQKIQPGARVLEVGCGIGTESVFLAVRGMQVSGLDISEAAIVRARQLAELYGVEADFQVGDVRALPFAAEEFDVVCDQGVFHHLYDDERAEYTKQILKVLRPGGMFLLRSYSDAIPGDEPQPRRIRSRELMDTFSPYFELEHLERVLSFSTPARSRPLGWHSIWLKSAH